MPTLIENLNLIESYKSDIKSAIEAKGVDMTGVTLSGYAEAIGDIQTGGLTESITIIDNGTYHPGTGIDGFSEVTVTVPQTGYTQKDITELTYDVEYLNNAASFVASQAFAMRNVKEVNLPNCEVVYDSAFQSCSKLSYLSLPLVTSIHQSAFYNCGSLQNVSLPECTHIEVEAFRLCTSLNTIDLPICKSIMTAGFGNCSALISVNLPECTYISTYAFNQCKSLESIDLPKCKYLGGSAFWSCISLINVSLPVCSYVSDSAFYNCYNLLEISLPECTFLGSAAFIYNYSLVSVDLPKVTNIKTNTFTGCSSLTYVSLPECLNIGNSAFENCRSLSEIDLPKCRGLGVNAFRSCYSLSQVSLPECRTLNGCEFLCCSSLSELNLPKCFCINSTAQLNEAVNCSILKIPRAHIKGQWYGNAVATACGVSQLYVCTELYEVPTYSWVIGTNTPLYSGTGSIYVNVHNYNSFITAPGWSSLSALITSVGDPEEQLLSIDENGCVYGSTRGIWSGFYGTSYLNVARATISAVSLSLCNIVGPSAFTYCPISSVSLPECIYVSVYAFASCPNLTTISLPKCEYVDYSAFRDAYRLSDIYLGACSVIYDNAFLYTPLNTINLPSTTFCELKYNVFPNTIQSIFVNRSLVDTYKSAANWSSYANKIYSFVEEFEFSNGLVYGTATSMDSTYLTTLSISASDVTGVNMYRLTDLASSTFMNHLNLTYVSLPLVSEYNDDLFNGCISLSEYNIEYTGGVVTLGTSVFDNCPALSTIGVPYGMLEEYQTAQGWSSYSSLIVEMLPILSYNNGLVFGRTNEINNGFITTLGITSDNVLSVSLPNCTIVKNGAFLEQHNVSSFYLPEVTLIESSAMFGCNMLNRIELPKCSYIGSGAFMWCAYNTAIRILSITLGYSDVCSLANTGAFLNTPQISVYVPASLVNSYKTAPNWAYYANRIFPIPE